MKIVTFLRKHADTPNRAVDFPLERDTFRNKIMEIVEDFDEKSYNNNGEPWKSSKILRVKPNFFIFLDLFVIFLHFFVSSIFHYSSFSFIFLFFLEFSFIFFVFFFLSKIFHFFHFFHCYFFYIFSIFFTFFLFLLLNPMFFIFFNSSCSFIFSFLKGFFSFLSVFFSFSQFFYQFSCSFIFFSFCRVLRICFF